MQSTKEIKVWDLLVRVFHWTLVLSFVIAYVTEEELLGPHVWAGYAALGLVALRVIWGLVGTRYARFADFVYHPATVIQYLKDIFSSHPRRYIGHNPAGGAMVVVMLLMLVATGLSGVALYGAEEGAGPLAAAMQGLGHSWGGVLEEGHEVLANVTVFLVVVHVAGVLLASAQHGENLARSMLTGVKRAEDDTAGANG